MASSKDSKTSKTAHVMNLLSRNRGGGEPETAAAPAEPASAAAPVEEPQAALQSPPKAPAPPILTSLKADAEVSSQIKNALEAELEDLPVPKAFSNEEMIRNILEYSEERWKEKRDSFMEMMDYYDDGHASEAVVDYMMERSFF